MECNRCAVQPIIHAFTQANLENSFGRMKNKQIIAAVGNLKTVFKGLCAKCHELPSDTNSLIKEMQYTWEEKFKELEKSIEKDNESMKPVLGSLQEAFQAVCLTCSRSSNDDNPSNHGQVFVSLDSGNCQANTGKAASTHTDNDIVQARADWIWLHKSADVEEQTYGMAPDKNLIAKEEGTKPHDGSVSMLPPEVEDRLRQEFSNFVSLDIIDKLLLSCIMSGMNVAEFAKMLWFPYAIVDPKTRKVKAITKQAAHARWKNIVRRFPVFLSVAIASTRDSEKARKKLMKFLADPNGEEQEGRFKNGKLAPMFARAAAKAKAIEEAKARAAMKKALPPPKPKKPQRPKAADLTLTLPGFDF